jgi:hypothetical protein
MSRQRKRDAFPTAGETGLATRPTDGEVLRSARLKARRDLLEQKLLKAKIAALEARGIGHHEAAVRLERVHSGSCSKASRSNEIRNEIIVTISEYTGEG